MGLMSLHAFLVWVGCSRPVFPYLPAVHLAKEETFDNQEFCVGCSVCPRVWDKQPQEPLKNLENPRKPFKNLQNPKKP